MEGREQPGVHAQRQPERDDGEGGCPPVAPERARRQSQVVHRSGHRSESRASVPGLVPGGRCHEDVPAPGRRFPEAAQRRARGRLLASAARLSAARRTPGAARRPRCAASGGPRDAGSAPVRAARPTVRRRPDHQRRRWARCPPSGSEQSREASPGRVHVAEELLARRIQDPLRGLSQGSDRVHGGRRVGGVVEARAHARARG